MNRHTLRRLLAQAIELRAQLDVALNAFENEAGRDFDGLGEFVEDAAWGHTPGEPIGLDDLNDMLSDLLGERED